MSREQGRELAARLFAGWPVAVSASRVLGEVWDQMDAQEKQS